MDFDLRAELHRLGWWAWKQRDWDLCFDATVAFAMAVKHAEDIRALVEAARR